SIRRAPRKRERGDELARASIAELLRRRCAPAENPADLAESFVELGRVVAAVHVGSAERLGATVAHGTDLAESRVARLSRRLGSKAAVRIANTYGRLVDADDLGYLIRVHGNLHLGSCERSRAAWALTRFGLRRDSTLDLDRKPSSPLADIASLLHSLQ